jgi:hypothetical protein
MNKILNEIPYGEIDQEKRMEVSVDQEITPYMEVQKTAKAMSDDGITYNEAGLTYNEVGYTYGGIYEGDREMMAVSVENHIPKFGNIIDNL